MSVIVGLPYLTTLMIAGIQAAIGLMAKIANRFGYTRCILTTLVITLGLNLGVAYATLVFTSATYVIATFILIATGGVTSPPGS